VATTVDRPFDLEDLFATPDDGNRYEILDGALVVTPPPGLVHQIVAGNLFHLLDDGARTKGLRAIFAPFAWRIGPGQVPEADLMVVSLQYVGERAVERPPLLVVEILSPTGRDRDLFEKRRIYGNGGAEWYWLVDPDEPSLTVLRLTGAEYGEDARVVGDEAYASDEPLPVRVVPNQLVV
jgi:Uma2 family endonuclease